MYGGLVMPTRSIAEPSDGSSATRARKRVGRSVPMSRPEEEYLVFANERIVRWVSAPRRIAWTEKGCEREHCEVVICTPLDSLD
jgi:hypothetical protein